MTQVAGARYEEVQCFLGGIDHLKAVDEELERLTDSQKSVRARLLEFETSDALRQTLQRKALKKSKMSANRKAALSGEALEAKLKAHKETNEKLRKQLLETGWSVPKLVGSLEPRVGAKKQSAAAHSAKCLLKIKSKLAAAKAKAKAKSAATSGGAPAPAAKSGAKSAKTPAPAAKAGEASSAAGPGPPPAAPPYRRSADRFDQVPEAYRRAWLCSEFLQFNTMPRAGADGPEGWAAELSSEEPMLLPGEILDLWIRFLIWNGGTPLQVGYMETYTLEKLKDAADLASRDRILEQLKEKFKHCSHFFLPICAGGHWVLLQASQEKRTVEFADSLHGPVSEVTLEAAGEALMYWKLMPSWSWVPTVPPERWNSCRQGPHGVWFLRGHLVGEAYPADCWEILPGGDSEG